MKTLPLCLLSLAAILPPLASADNAQIYKWTDAADIVHYSDKPPVESVADLQTLDMPAFPAQDPAQLAIQQAAQQAALISQTATVQQLLDAQAAQRQQAAALAEQQAQLQATLVALQQAQSQPEPETEPLIYSSSDFVPVAYRRNLYLPHRPVHSKPSRPSTPSRPAISLFSKP